MNHCWKLLQCYFSTCSHSIDLYWHRCFFSCWGQDQLWWTQQHGTKSQNRPIKLLSPLLQSPCSVSPSCLGTHVQESCGGFPSCPFSQVSTPQDPSESIGLTAQNLRCYFSKPRCPCYVLSHCFGGKQTPPPPNLTENTNSQFARFKVVLKAGYFRC